MRSIVLCCLLCLPAAAVAQAPGHGGHDLGAVDFGVSCQEAVRGEFDRAVALLHHMMYEGSRAAFEQIAERDPACAMAHWGVAMTLFQPLWPTRPSTKDLERGAASVQRALDLKPATDRERSLVNAALEFFKEPGTAEWWTRIHRWSEAMQAAYEVRPDDIETAALFALSTLAVAPEVEDRLSAQARAAEVLLDIHRRQPTHPGAVHYTIHANDVGGREDRSLDVVKSYDDLAPTVPHALHMPTHIYVRLGDWPGVIDRNRKSADTALMFPAGDRVSHHYVHASDYLVYAQLQRGEDREAARVIQESLERSPHQESFVSAFHIAAMPARFAVERRQWEEARDTEVRGHAYLPWDHFWWPEAISWFAKGLGAVHTGDLVGARAAESRMRALRDRADQAGEEAFRRYIEVDRLVLAGWIAQSNGDMERAEALMREAAGMEESVEKHPVTPGALYPPNEALGDLLTRDRPADAVEAFAAALRTWPKRYNSLLGAARAARRTGDVEVARGYYAELLTAVGEAQASRSGVAEARDFVGR